MALMIPDQGGSSLFLMADALQGVLTLHLDPLAPPSPPKDMVFFQSPDSQSVYKIFVPPPMNGRFK
jgi:hypothetical protein